jgi:hypothetical protein
MYVFKGLINQLATYSKVNDCFISLTCLIVIYLLIHRLPIKYHNFGVFVYDSAEKQMLDVISLVIEERI